MLRHPLRKTLGPASILMIVAVTFGVPAAHASPSNVRLTNDSPALSGYVSDYTLVTGTPYTDSILSGCSQSRGRQNEPAVAVDPRNPDVIVGSSNDYCGVFNDRRHVQSDSVRCGSATTARRTAARASSARSCRAIRVTQSPYAARARHPDRRLGRPGAGVGQPRTAVRRLGELGRPREGRQRHSATSGSRRTRTRAARTVRRIEDGKEFVGSLDVAKGSAAPNLLGRVPRQDGDRGRPHGWIMRRERVLRVGAVHRRRFERLQLERLLRALDGPRSDVLVADEAEPDRARHPVPRYLGDG